MSLASFVHFSLVALAWILAAAWSIQALIAAVGLRHVHSLLAQQFAAGPAEGTSIVVIVPACNEQHAIAQCIQSLLDQDWPNLQIIAVDDRSTDGTGMILDELKSRYPDRLSALHITALPEGWLGKTHAMAQAAEYAKARFQPQWLLFTDADVLFHPECLRRSLALAEAQRADHLVVTPTAIIHTAGEGMVMSFLQVMGLWGTRLWKVADPSTRDAVGIGAFNLLRASAYEQLGGFRELRLQILEDLTLARLVKDSGLRQRVAFAPGYVRIHWASGIRGVLNTMTKNLFAVFSFRLGFMAAACAGLFVLCLGPCLFLAWTPTRVPSLLTLVAIAGLYRTSWRYLTKITPLFCFGFPVSAVLFLYAIFKSTAVTLWSGGVRWRGTFYSLQELRKVAIKLR